MKFVCRESGQAVNQLESRASRCGMEYAEKAVDGIVAGVDSKTHCSFDVVGNGLEYSSRSRITITSFALAKQILKSKFTKQAGFNAEIVKLFPQKNTSVLFLEGEAHRRRRSLVARFFAPAAIRERYRPAMDRLSERMVRTFVQNGRAVLDEMSLALSVGIAAEIVGMTESRRPGLADRLGRFFEGDACMKTSGFFAILRYILVTQIDLLRVYLVDVRPAIRARRRAPREDLISHLLEQGWSDLDILKECVTYGTAGLSTTREFIVAAAWHLLDQEPLRRRFLAADASDQAAILGEILRLEPPVGTLHRTATAELVVEDRGEITRIPAGTHISIELQNVNTDPAATGRCPFSLLPDREWVGAVGWMSFGDGHHRCPGAAVALEETVVFLDHLLRVPHIRLASPPTVARNKMSTGYILRGAVVTTE